MYTSDKHHTIYRQDAVITIRDVELELTQQRTRKDIKAGKLFCSHGTEMTYVICRQKTNHFRHVYSNIEKSGAGGTSKHPPAMCSCSSKHLDAQVMLRDHNYKTQPVMFTEWRDCHRPGCCKVVYTASGKPEVRLEVREQGGKFVSDVVYYEDGKPRMRVEVLATHKADRARRAGTEFVEVSAEHVIALLKKEGAPSLSLRSESSCTGQYEVCQPCAEKRRVCEEKRRAEEAQHRFAQEEQLRIRVERRVWEEQRRVAEAQRRIAHEEQRRAEEAQRRIAHEEQRRVEEAQRRIAHEEQRRAEEAQRRIAEEEQRRVAEEEQRLLAAARTPGFNVTLSTSIPDVSQDEIERRRKQRMDRQVADRQAADRQAAKRMRRQGPSVAPRSAAVNTG
jgi:hypothetical protein